MDDDTLYIIDFDRTLSDVDKVMELVAQTCSELGIDYSGIQDAQQKAFMEGRSYSPLDTIERRGKDKYHSFIRKFVESADPAKLIFPDGKRYLDNLKAHDRQYMILTYASDAKWQEMKLKATGLYNAPHLITFNTHKSRDIAGWRNTDGKYAPPVSGMKPAARIIFIDDRLRALQGLPQDCQGYFLDRTGSDLHPLPPNIAKIQNLDQIIDKN